MKKNYYISIIYLNFIASYQCFASDFNFQISPYIYMPNVYINANLPHIGNISRNASFSELNENRDGSFFTQALAIKNNWVNIIDFNYAKASMKGSLNNFNNLNLNLNLKYKSIDVLSGYRFNEFNNENLSVDILGGFSYWFFKVKISNPSISYSKEWIDPIIAGRIKYAITPNVTILGHLEKNLSIDKPDYQIVGTLNYNLTENFIFSTGYRYQYIKPPMTFEVRNKTSGLLIGLSYLF